jgi:hypothetical protein
MISPTVGRVVWFYPAGASPNSQPTAGVVAYVHTDRCVNIGGFDHNGNYFAACSVLLVQDGDPVPGGGYYAEWMPYQRGQAAKADALMCKITGVQK